MKAHWTSGNSATLLENGEDFFPRIVDAIEKAKREILVETFILRDDKVGQNIKRALVTAANRGVVVTLTVDGYGSYFLPKVFIDELTDAGIIFCMYDPPPKWMSYRTNLFRRLHRKLLVVDGNCAYVGGINLSHNHLREYGPNGKQDYAVELFGPIVYQIRRFMISQLQNHFKVVTQFPALPRPDKVTSGGLMDVQFLTRDNQHHATDIENAYLTRIAKAKQRIIIANAYFFPGYRLLRELRSAARRGVQVKLVIQGKPGSTLAMKTAPMLYEFLVESNIEVYEYWERQYHGKIAAIDDEWSTVGSSNLDPLSLSLNLEANIVIRSKEFNSEVASRIDALIQQSEIRKINDSWIHRRTLWKWFRTLLVFHFLRHFPAWVGWLPAHTPRISTGAVDNPEHLAQYGAKHDG